MKKYMMIIFFIMVLAWGGNQKCFADTITDYSALPLFMSTNLLPNIMLIVDNSGSMFSFAYYDTAPGHDDYGKVLSGVTQPYITTFNPGHEYYGYFNSFSWYTYASSRFAPSSTKSSLNPGSNPTSAWDGNFLNWLTMRRADIIRKVLTGGRVVATGGENRLVGEPPDDASFRGRYKQITNAELYTPLSGTKLFDVNASGGTARVSRATS